MQRSWINIAAMVFGASFGAPATAKVFVHLGYIDEELSPALRDIIANNPNTDVVAIESDKFQKPEAFQKTRSFYSPRMSALPPSVLSQESIAALSNGLQSISNDPSTRAEYDALTLRDVPIESGPKSPFQFLIFASDANQRSSDLIVVVKPPEFGRQPQLLTSFLGRFLNIVSKLPQASNGISVTSLGTAGSVQPSLPVGSATNVRGSLYAGVERATGEGKTGYVGVIKFFDPILSKEIPLWRSEPIPNFNSAITTVQDQLANPAQMASLTHSEWETPLKERIDQLNRWGFGSSLTLSFFGGESEKTLAQGLGLSNVNMEDFHVLNESSKVADNFRIIRVISDPHSIPEWFVDGIYRWAKSERYTRKDYTEAILWGLNGLSLENAPARATWNIRDHVQGDLSRITYQTTQLNGLLDPFYVELSVKLLDDAIERRAISIESVSKKITEKLSEEAQKRLIEALDAHSALLASAARRIKGTHEAEANRNVIESQIQVFLDLLSDFNIAKYPEVERDIASIISQLDPARRSYITTQKRIPLFSDNVGSDGFDKSRMAIWVRSSKWTSRSNKLQYVAPALSRDDYTLSAAKGFEAISLSEIAIRTGDKNLESFARVADRAIYRSSMTAAMSIQSKNQLGANISTLPMTVFRPRSCGQLNSQR